MSRTFISLIFSLVLIVPTSAAPNPSWEKQCAKTKSSRCAVIAKFSPSTVFDKVDARIALISNAGPNPEYVRVLLPLGAQLKHGTRLLINDEKPILAQFHHCRADGCVANFLDKEIPTKFRSAKSLGIQFIDVNGRPVTISFPMADFKAADELKLVSLKSGGGSADDQINYRAFLAGAKPSSTTHDFTVDLATGVWRRFCRGNVCFIGIDGRLGNGQTMIAAVVIDSDAAGAKKRTLRITLPLEIYLGTKPQLSLSDYTPIVSDYAVCLSNGCMIDFDVGDQLIDAMKLSKDFTVTVTATTGDVWKGGFALSGFGKALDGPGDTDEAGKLEGEKHAEKIKKSGRRLERWRGPKTTFRVTKGYAPEL